MAEVSKIAWAGYSKKEYLYWIYSIGTTFESKAGNYIFAKETRPGYWVPGYVGQTSNLNQRLGDHEKEAQAKRNGATHIHVHLTSGGESVRIAEERDLILCWDPPCNEQIP